MFESPIRGGQQVDSWSAENPELGARIDDFARRFLLHTVRLISSELAHEHARLGLEPPAFTKLPPSAELYVISEHVASLRQKQEALLEEIDELWTWPRPASTPGKGLDRDLLQ